jgi:hypothetical protein
MFFFELVFLLIKTVRVRAMLIPPRRHKTIFSITKHILGLMIASFFLFLLFFLLFFPESNVIITRALNCRSRRVKALISLLIRWLVLPWSWTCFITKKREIINTIWFCDCKNTQILERQHNNINNNNNNKKKRENRIQRHQFIIYNKAYFEVKKMSVIKIKKNNWIVFLYFNHRQYTMYISSKFVKELWFAGWERGGERRK